MLPNSANKDVQIIIKTKPARRSYYWTRANSAFYPFGVGKWVVIHGLREVETNKRQTRAACGSLAAKAASPCVRA